MTSTNEDIAAIAQISADSALRELGEHVPQMSGVCNASIRPPWPSKGVLRYAAIS
ncbi:MAG: hypothetical protein ABJE95_12945 [Byssovorax sp.]